MPGQQGAWGHDPVQPQVPGQKPCQGGEHGTVRPVRRRARDLPAQDRDLMTQQENLRILRSVTPCQQHQPAEHPDHEEIEEANEHERRA